MLRVLTSLALLALLALLTLLAAARACSVCVARVCHQPHVLLERFRVSDHIALDHGRRHNVLYVQLDGDTNNAYHLDAFRIVRLQHLNTTGMAVDQNTHALYTADYSLKLYRFEWEKRDPIIDESLLHEEADRLFYKDALYYTSKSSNGLNIIEDNMSKAFKQLKTYPITDFVVNKKNNIYFVSDNKVYVYNKKWDHAPLLIASKTYTLSTDKFGDVYLSDATENAIHKLDESNKMTLYAAYREGSVERFVFDKDNNVVFHDPESETVAYWKSTGAECEAEPPHHKYVIKDGSERNTSCDTLRLNGLESTEALTL